VIAGVRLRAGRAGSARGAASMVTDAVTTAKALGAADILVRGDSAYGNAAVVSACRRAGARFSLVLAKNPAVVAAIASIDDAA
jgi:predicted SpoU family rRNA methylase